MIIHNKGSPDVIKLILDAGADVHQVVREGGSPLSMAVEAGNVEVIQLLLQAGANPNPTDGNVSVFWSFAPSNILFQNITSRCW